MKFSEIFGGGDRGEFGSTLAPGLPKYASPPLSPSHPYFKLLRTKGQLLDNLVEAV